MFEQELRQLLDEPASPFSDDLDISANSITSGPQNNATINRQQRNSLNNNNNNINTNRTQPASTDIAPNQLHQARNEAHPYRKQVRNNNNNNNNDNNKTLSPMDLLQKIYSQTTNIAKQTNKNTIQQTLKEAIKREGPKEIETSQATITIKKDPSTNLDNVKKIIQEEWVEKQKQLSPTMWEDKKQEFIYVQFLNNSVKRTFLDNIKEHQLLKSIKLGDQKDSRLHYIRRPVKIEIARVRESMNMQTIITTLQTACNNNIKITNIKEGKPHNITKTRIVSFLTDAPGLNEITEKMRWKIPYFDITNNIKATLFMKISCKPWLCKDCFMIGNHSCKGKSCGKCASTDHTTKDCNQEEFCSNCHIKGHSARDAHCQQYLNLLIRNLVQMDVPDSYLIKENRMNILLENIQLK